MRHFIAPIFSLICISTALAQSPATQPEPVTLDAIERAESTMLRNTIDRQAREIELLKEKVDALTQQLASLGFKPDVVTSNPTTRPAKPPTTASAGTSKRVVFVIGSASGVAEVDRAIQEMSADQRFNVVFISSKAAETFHEQMIPANDLNKSKASEFLNKFRVYPNDWLQGIEAAARWRPETIWFVPPHRMSKVEEEQFFKELKRINAVSHSKINCVTPARYLGVGPEYHHRLWRISQETGGVYLDWEGNVVEEEPVVPPPAAKEPAKPTILRDPR